MFADDATFFCQGGKEDLDAILHIYKEHCTASGSMMNEKKTLALWLGNGSRPDWTHEYKFHWVKVGEIIRHLGFPLGVDISTLD